jgi:hypothetical protein
MATPHQVWGEKAAKQIITWLEKRRMLGSYFATAAEAKEKVLAMVPDGAVVYRSGSMTTVDMGIWEALESRTDVEIINPYQPGLSPEEGLSLRRRGLTADIMISSSNAITLDGKLVNLDGMGNRVSAMCFGPEKVIMVVGMNKVVADVDAAISRVKNLAAPPNSIRLDLDNPCTKTGLCADCRSPQRICNMWSIIEGHMIKDRIHVVLVGEALGY